MLKVGRLDEWIFMSIEGLGTVVKEREATLRLEEETKKQNSCPANKDIVMKILLDSSVQRIRVASEGKYPQSRRTTRKVNQSKIAVLK